MAVKTYNPQVQVTLLKLVGRKDGMAERYGGGTREIDLTPFLGEAGAVRTIKSLTDPAGGFSVSFPDKVHKELKDSLYAAIEPMDCIEIRGSREPFKHSGGKLPLIMRGYVSNVRRSESIGQDGSPQRVVVVTGQDAGKLWLINQIFFEVVALIDRPYLETFRLQAATGIEAAWLPVSDFMKQVTERVVNPKVQKLYAMASRQLQPFRVDATVTQGVVIPRIIGEWQGPVWGLVSLFADRPWNELFVEDEEDQPVLRFRPAPYKDIKGQFIMPGAAEPDLVTLEDADVVSLDVTRSDNRVANYFWVPPGASLLDTNGWNSVAALQRGEPLDFDYANNRPELYGIKKMEVGSRLLPDLLHDVPLAMPPAERGKAQDDYIVWHIDRMKLLKAMNRDNVALEEGEATVKGSEDLKAGRYLWIKRGDLTAEYYMTRVAHTIAPFRGWTTSLTLERGTGFLDRSKSPGSPYWQEGRKGPYSA